MKKDVKSRFFKENGLIVITRKEKIVLVIKSVLVVFVMNYFFYRSVWAMIPLAAVGAFYFKLETEALIAKKKLQVKEQFRELLHLVSNSQRAGYSVENAFVTGYGDMKILYGQESVICKILKRIRIAYENRKPLAAVWEEIGEELKVEEIREFARVYYISGEKSGNVAVVMEKTASQIAEKMDTEKEIQVMLSEKRLEQKIMNLMPFLIMAYIMLSSPGYFNGLYGTVTGVVIMSICLGIYLLSYRASLKIVDIHL